MVISAIILAAGESRRMGRPKMLLPWGHTSVLGHVISIFRRAGIEDILIVTGAVHGDVEQVVEKYQARSVFNERYASGEMLISLQRGIEAQRSQTQATLIALGDQPQIQERTVRLIRERFRQTASRLIVPSYHMKRGHPWLVEQSLWNELVSMDPKTTPRHFLNQHAKEIEYVPVETASVLADIDTMEDYQKARSQL